MIGDYGFLNGLESEKGIALFYCRLFWAGQGRTGLWDHPGENAISKITFGLRGLTLAYFRPSRAFLATAACIHAFSGYLYKDSYKPFLLYTFLC